MTRADKAKAVFDALEARDIYCKYCGVRGRHVPFGTPFITLRHDDLISVRNYACSFCGGSTLGRYGDGKVENDQI